MSDPTVATVAGFPSGKHHSLVKGAEARLAVEQGAREVDMVIDVGAAVAGDWNAVLADILTVREAIGFDPVLKVIIESAVLSDDAIVEACRQHKIEIALPQREVRLLNAPAPDKPTAPPARPVS